MSLISELRRRNVFRVAAAYIVVAWLVIQVVETIFPAFGFGESAIRFIVIIFAIGLVPTLVFAWLFEFTSAGLVRETKSDLTRPIAPRSERAFDRVIMIVLALAVGFFAFDKFILEPGRISEIQKTTAEQARSQALVESYGDSSIAVLPFVNMSEDASNEYFSDGISEELLNLLAKIPRLRVISQSSSFSFKGKDIAIPKLAAQLNVAFVMEGSVRKFGKQVRITAQLIEARSDTHLWSETYDRTLDDLFAIQDEIAAAIVDELKNKLRLDVGSAPRPGGEIDADAHDAILRGRYLLAQRTSDSRVAAVAEFERAVSLDPDYAPAHAELALALTFAPHGELSQEEYSAKISHHIETAMALDPDIAEAHAAKAWLALENNDREETKAQFRRAIEINPNYAIVYVWMGNLGLFQSHEEAFAALEKGLRLDPLSRVGNFAYLNALIERGRLTEADRQIEKYSSIDPRGAVIMRGIRSSIGGNWSEYVLAYLSAASSGSGELVFGPAFREDMIVHLAAVGLVDEAVRLSGANEHLTYDLLQDREAEIGLAQEELKDNPNSREARMTMGLAFARAGRYDEARRYLEREWQTDVSRLIPWGFGETYAEIAAAMVAILRNAGDGTAASQVLLQFKETCKRFRKAGMVFTEFGSSVDFQEGQAAYLAGERNAGLSLMSRAAEDGYWVGPPAAFQRSMYQDPAFAIILKQQTVRQARERKKILAVVCKDNPYSALWQPTRQTCQQLLHPGH